MLDQRHELPVDASGMTRFLQRIGEGGCEKILQRALKARLESRTIRRSDLKRVTVDTKVQDKAVTLPLLLQPMALFSELASAANTSQPCFHCCFSDFTS